jgi:hypothetical protein
MGVMWSTGSYYSGSYSYFGSGTQNRKESDIKEPPQESAMILDGTLIRAWWNKAHCRIGNSPISDYFAPHFSNDEYTYNGTLNPTPQYPDLVAGGGKTSVSFIDGHGDARPAADFLNSGLNNASWQLDVN